ncbi:IPT/TIG domain-containing protein [Shewanella spartinae]|uniref:IPT/TIG domain-containing protein n=1 Tax=Shewanella spartinae TaxID=2864205 RepID=UPI001C6562FD|nr:IPT/TIG domain-containing protein [Shewanella spartinae]QYJ94418.1 IPT/TIG domain-containing protein [Shewanella spartinae]
MKHTSRLTKQHWLALMLTSTLAITGCNGELKEGEGPNSQVPTDPVDPVDPTNPTEPTEPTDPTDPTAPPQVGTWENRDEDGDGVVDELDDYPFDASKHAYPLFVEQEPNDNPAVATPIEIDLGVRVQGVIDSEFDKGDLFKFHVDKPQSYTAYFTSPSARFKPQVYVSDANGLVINDIQLYRYTRANTYVVNFPVYTPGTYQLSIIDENYAGGSDLTYQVTMFNDQDIDGFDDTKEPALGADINENDQDKDKIIDGIEFSMALESLGLDTDRDGIPNWLDTDSDGDSFNDSIEGMEDLDNDGAPNFLERDADGNGIDDQLESGNSNDPTNTDNDKFIDHLDNDDDNDDIFDKNDAQRLIPATIVSWTKPGDLFIESLHTLFQQNKIKNYLRAGDEFELTVEGVSSASENTLLVVNINGRIYNLFPKQVEHASQRSHLRFLLPQDMGKGALSIVIGTNKSDPFPIEIGDAELPLLMSSNPRSLKPGQQITLSGDNFDEDTSVFFNNQPVNAQFVDENTVRTTVPETLSGGSYSVSNAHGQSNPITFIITQEIAVNVLEPSAKPLAAIGGIYPEMAKALNGNSFELEKMGSEAEVIFSYTQGADGQLEAYLSTVYSMNQDSISLSFESTALASLVLHMNYYYEAKGVGTEKFMQIVQTTQAYQAYLAEAKAALAKDTSFFGYKARKAEAYDLLNRFESKIKEELTSKRLLKSSLSPSKARLTPLDDGAAGSSTNQALSAIEPSIVSYPETNGTWQAFDMSMAATTFAENSTEIMNNCGEGVDPKWYQVLNADGCVEIRNRSQLYLSARIYPIDSKTGEIKTDLASLNKPIADHITTPWDSGMMGPQSGTWLGISLWSSDSLIDKCVYTDCLYQIITPGVDGIFGPSPFSFRGLEAYDKRAQDARKMLAIRTIIDNVVIRFYSILFDAAGIDLNDSKYKKQATALAIVKAVYQYLPAISTEIDKLMAKDKPSFDDWQTLAANLGKELYSKEIKAVISDPTNRASYGPVTMALLTALEVDEKYFINKMLQKVAQKFIPGWGTITSVYEASKLADSMVDMAKTIDDLVDVPTKLDYIVTWGLKASDITPRAIEKTQETKRFTIVGSGMAVVKGVFGDTKPEVKVFDLGKGEKQLDTSFVSVNKLGTELTFDLNDISQIENAVGPLKVEVHHRDEVAEVPYEILIGTDLTITNITPNKASPGTELEISGIGFSKQPMGNIVTFSGANGERIRAAVKSATTDTLVIIVPNGAVTGYITVEVANILSNQYPFVGPSQLLITFGDNGNFNDDVFKLSVNNKVMYDNNQPQRKVGPLNVSLEEGEHTVQLTGIRADDGIATYYIEFAGDVVNVSGDALTGRDLCPNTHKTYKVTIASGADSSGQSASLKAQIQPMILQPEYANMAAETPTECPKANQ